MALTPERKTAILDTLTMIQEDVAADTDRREGQPFTGQNVAAALGEICAQIGSLARIIEIVLTEGD